MTQLYRYILHWNIWQITDLYRQNIIIRSSSHSSDSSFVSHRPNSRVWKIQPIKGSMATFASGSMLWRSFAGITIRSLIPRPFSVDPYKQNTQNYTYKWPTHMTYKYFFLEKETFCSQILFIWMKHLYFRITLFSNNIFNHVYTRMYQGNCN